jgi:hypothetical protein
MHTRVTAPEPLASCPALRISNAQRYALVMVALQHGVTAAQSSPRESPSINPPFPLQAIKSPTYVLLGSCSQCSKVSVISGLAHA